MAQRDGGPPLSEREIGQSGDPLGCIRPRIHGIPVVCTEALTHHASMANGVAPPS